MAETKWRNITKEIEAAASVLQHGEMIHGENFSLKGVMSSSESMDPKMDPGFNLLSVRTATELLLFDKTLPIPDDTLHPRFVIGAMCDMLRAEAAWIDGRAGPQHTFFSCAYLQLSPEMVTSTWLWPYIHSLFVTSAIIRDVVSGADIVNPEDFISYDCPQLAGGIGLNITAWKKTSKSDSIDTIEETFLEIEETIKKALTKEEEGEFKGIAVFLKLRRSLFGMHRALLDCDFGKAKKFINEGLEQINPLLEFGKLAERPLNSFNPLMWKRITTPVAVREVDFPDFPSSVKMIQKHLTDMSTLLEVLNIPLIEYFSLYFFMLKYCEIPRCPIARSWLQFVIQTPDKTFKKTKVEISTDSLLAFPIPSRLVKNSISTEFVAQLSIGWTETFRYLGKTPARQRREIAKVIKTWEIIQSASLAADKKLIAQYSEKASSSKHRNARDGHFFTIYVLFAKNLVMNRYLELGFELELYSQDEYYEILWYEDYLYSILLTQYNEMVTNGTEFENRFAVFKKSSKKKEVNPNEKLYQKLQLILKSYIQSQALTTRGAFRYLTLLYMVGVMKRKDNYPFGSPQMRYDQRFRVFNSLVIPQQFSYKQFIEATDYSKLTFEKVLEATFESYNSAKESLTKYQQEISGNACCCWSFMSQERAKGWLRTIITNIVSLQSLKPISSQNNYNVVFENVVPKLDLSFHPYHLIITLPNFKH